MPKKKRMNSKSYEVGYGKPPKETQFQPGESGNPKGRPKGLCNFSTDLHSTLTAPVQVTEGGKKRKASTQMASLLRLREKALNGDVRSLDRLLGYAAQYNNRPEDQAEVQPIGEDDKAILENYLARITPSAKSLPGGPKRSQRRVRIKDHPSERTGK